MQVRREHRGALPAGLVAADMILGQRAAQETLQPRVRAGLARMPGLAQAGRPIGTGRQQRPLLQPVGPGLGVRRLDPGHRRLGRGRAGGEAGAGEGGVDAVGSAGAGADGTEVEQRYGPLQPQDAAVLGKLGGDAGLLLARPGLRREPGEHRRRADLGRQPRELDLGAAASQHQRPAGLAHAGVERRQAVMQPPAGGASERPGTSRRVIEHVGRDQRAGRGGGGQRRVVGEAQVVAEPEDAGVHGPEMSTMRRTARRPRSGRA